MGRETKILLGFLGLLAGVFVGVLSMKLLVPRPPAGAGPDVHLDGASAGGSHELVAPPTLSPRGWDFTAAPPLVAAAALPAATEPATADHEIDPSGPDARSRFTSMAVDPPSAELLPPAPPPVPPLQAPPTVAAVAPDRTSAPVEPDLLPPVAAAPLSANTGLGLGDHLSPTAGPAPVQPATALASQPEPAAPASLPPRINAAYTVQPGDSWWSLAAAAYGDGRLYRALFAWNRTLDGRVTLAPGTRLEIPPVSKLQAAWPRLVPQ